ncbi:GntR family transcriptional regulator [Acidithiobacillus sp. HP-2]|uniref:GntR family transcriptional regulator n=2 Tax=unclassified Acidithiobacillus TaxID=2614800 RepID=UPI001D0D79F1|nr:GntR family transcriptional regulator [Acidithiobacillus sp. HP-2]
MCTQPHQAAGTPMISTSKVQFVPGITIWKQIVNDLQARIDSGELVENQKLPGEADLAKAYGVNRHTMRRALQELAAVGKVRIQHGRGSFVAKHVFDYELVERPRFSEWVKKYNKPGKNDILEAAILNLADLPELARIQQYGVFPEYPQVAMIKTLGRVGEEPISIARHLFFGKALLALVDDLHAGRGITESLRQHGIQDYTRMRSTISATMSGPQERDLLKVEKGEIVFVCENVNVDTSGVGIEFSTVIYPSSRVRLVYEPG